MKASPLQKLIKKAEYLKSGANNYHELVRIELFLREAKSLLPEERQNIIEAYEEACMHYAGTQTPLPHDKEDAVYYFTQTFKQQ